MYIGIREERKAGGVRDIWTRLFLLSLQGGGQMLCVVGRCWTTHDLQLADPGQQERRSGVS